MKSRARYETKGVRVDKLGCENTGHRDGVLLYSHFQSTGKQFAYY